jgi:hypothetical protein
VVVVVQVVVVLPQMAQQVNPVHVGSLPGVRL